MKKVCSLGVLAVAVLLAATVASPVFGAGGGPPDEVVTGQYIVLVADGIDPETVASDHGLRPLHVYRVAVNGFAAGGVTDDKRDVLQTDARVLAVEQDRIWRTLDQPLPTGINRIETDKKLGAITDPDTSVTISQDVAIIDTGIDKTHPDLNVAGGRNFTTNKRNDWNDGHGHGTHVAGTVGAMDNGIGVVGVAPGVRVWGVKVCSNGGVCFTSHMIAGINWVAERKGDRSINFASANMSIGTPDDDKTCISGSLTDALHLAICGLVNKGVVFALAAGNSNALKKAYPEVMAVSALADFNGVGGGGAAATCRTDVDDTRADFSNYGASIDIAAPGVCIRSTWKDGGYNIISGTSMAAPHVAGAVALYLHANNKAPATDGAGVDVIEKAIIDAAIPQSHRCGYTNDKSGEPLLFVNAAAFGGGGESCD